MPDVDERKNYRVQEHEKRCQVCVNVIKVPSLDRKYEESYACKLSYELQLKDYKYHSHVNKNGICDRFQG